MRSPEQIAADLENMAEQYARPSYPFLADADALLREAAEALRLPRPCFDCQVLREAVAERDALIAFLREHAYWHETSHSIAAYEALPESVRQKIEAVG